MAENCCYCDPETEICYNHVCCFDDCCFFDECDGFVSTDGERCNVYRDCYTCVNHDCPCQTDTRKWLKKETAQLPEETDNCADRG